MQGRGGNRVVARMAMALLAALGALTAGASTAGADNSTVVGQWRFDEGGGQVAVDDGASGLDGRLGLQTTPDDRDPQRVGGFSGGALRFDGRTFVRLPDAPELEPPTLTLEAVVRAPSSPGRFRYVVSHGAQGCIAGSYGLYTAEDGGLAFYVFDGQYFRVTAAIGPGEIWNGGWHHVAGVFTGNTLRFYLDGRPVGAPISTPSNVAYVLASTDTYFGTYQGTCALPFRGDIDLIRMWRGPLAADFVGTLSDEALTPPAATVPPTTGSPENVPTADAGASQGDAPASRPAITPIAEGLAVPMAFTPPSGTAPSRTAGAPARACVIKPSTKRLRVGRRTKLTVEVALRGQPLRAVKVTAVDTRSRRRLATAKTSHDGRARLRVTPRRRGRIHLEVPGRADCAATALTVLRARAK